MIIKYDEQQHSRKNEMIHTQQNGFDLMITKKRIWGVSRRTRGDGGIASRVAEAMLRWGSPQEILGFVTSLWPSEPDAPLVEAQRIPKVGETEERAARVLMASVSPNH